MISWYIPVVAIDIHQRLSFFFPVEEWKETGQGSQGSSSLQDPVLFAVSVLKIHLQQRKTPTYRDTKAALHMLTHALLQSTSLHSSPEKGLIHSFFF